MKISKHPLNPSSKHNCALCNFITCINPRTHDSISSSPLSTQDKRHNARQIRQPEPEPARESSGGWCGAAGEPLPSARASRATTARVHAQPAAPPAPAPSHHPSAPPPPRRRAHPCGYRSPTKPSLTEPYRLLMLVLQNKHSPLFKKKTAGGWIRPSSSSPPRNKQVPTELPPAPQLFQGKGLLGPSPRLSPAPGEVCRRQHLPALAWENIGTSGSTRPARTVPTQGTWAQSSHFVAVSFHFPSVCCKS